jgi:hypothetical protein
MTNVNRKRKRLLNIKIDQFYVKIRKLQIKAKKKQKKKKNATKYSTEN